MAESLSKKISFLGTSPIFTNTTIFKRSYLFLTTFPDLEEYTIKTLPPEKASRPTYEFTSKSYEHLTQTISYPLKMKYQQVEFTWYDIVQDLKNPTNVIYNWISKFNNPETGYQGSPARFKTRIQLGMYTSEGEIIETWIYEGAYPVNVRFGAVDMANMNCMTITATLQYDRAYWISRLGGVK
jgi:hypothetical protein